MCDYTAHYWTHALTPALPRLSDASVTPVFSASEVTTLRRYTNLFIIIIIIIILPIACYTCAIAGLSGRMVSASDCGVRGSRFESRR